MNDEINNKKVPILGSPGVVRDLHSKAIIYNNNKTFDEARKRKQRIKDRDDRIYKLESSVKIIGNELQGIKDLLNKILEKV